MEDMFFLKKEQLQWIYIKAYYYSVYVSMNPYKYICYLGKIFMVLDYFNNVKRAKISRVPTIHQTFRHKKHFI